MNRITASDKRPFILFGASTRNQKQALRFITHRFPSLQNAPLVENRVCPYENSPDGNFIFDQHPEAANCWLLGGGSGHGYKHGPALGELVADVLTGNQALVPFSPLLVL